MNEFIPKGRGRRHTHCCSPGARVQHVWRSELALGPDLVPLPLPASHFTLAVPQFPRL